MNDLIKYLTPDINKYIVYYENDLSDSIIELDELQMDSITHFDSDVISTDVYVPSPIVPHNIISNNYITFTQAMRLALSYSIYLNTTPLTQTDFVGRASNSNHYRCMHTNIQDRFNTRIVPILADGNCFFRAFSHIIFGNESEHNKVRVSLINTFEQNLYVPALCCIQGYNEKNIQQHFTEMKRNSRWGTVNELIILGILDRINVSYVIADKGSSK